jgi:hypothetical protein
MMDAVYQMYLVTVLVICFAESNLELSVLIVFYANIIEIVSKVFCFVAKGSITQWFG